MQRIIKISSVVLFIGLLVVQLSQDFIIMSWYKYNRKELTEKYCINRDLPEIMCNAKCYISSILVKSDSNSQYFSSGRDIITTQYFLEDVDEWELSTPLDISVLHQFYFADDYLFRFSHSIDHPPKV